MNTTLTTDIDKVYEEFQTFTTKEMKSSLKSALNTAGNKLKGETKSLFRKALPAASKSNPKYSDKMIDAVRRSKVKETSQHEMYVKVHIMGTRNTGSGTYRARFFEAGTRLRRTRKGYYRGSIKALNFFATANFNFNADYDRIVDESVQKAVNKINNKRYK